MEENAILRFTDNPSDYLPAVMTSWEGMECYNYSPLLYAMDCENIAITGKGTLAPIMDTWKIWFKRPKPHMDALKELYTMASTDVPVEQRQMAKGENHLRPHLIHFNRIVKMCCWMNSRFARVLFGLYIFICVMVVSYVIWM